MVWAETAPLAANVTTTTASAAVPSHWIDVGFGTAALGGNCHQVVTMALEHGFRRFDTAEAEWWYDQAAVGRALHDYFTTRQEDDECLDDQGHFCGMTCHSEDLRISTKIPPWSLTSEYDMRRHAANSRQELVGFCEHEHHEGSSGDEVLPFPLDVYFIHAPACWEGWHPRCRDPPPTLDLKSAWRAMEVIVGHDKTVRRIGLSNVHPPDLREIIRWVKERQTYEEQDAQEQQRHARTTDGGEVVVAPPRLPDAVQAYADPIYPARELRQICQEHGIEFVSYSTLGSQHRSGSGGNPVLGSPIVQELATKYQRSTAEIVLQWARQHGMSVIPRSSQRPHIAELARLLDDNNQFQLAPDDLARIDAMAR